MSEDHSTMGRKKLARKRTKDDEKTTKKNKCCVAFIGLSYYLEMFGYSIWFVSRKKKALTSPI